MNDCPIGLICSDFKCDRRYCQDLAEPWPLPYYLNPCWMKGVGLLVVLPSYEWDCPNIEHMITENERYNNWVQRVRDDYWLGGWWSAVDLPYETHPERGMLVIHHLKIDEEITFSRPWHYDPRMPYKMSCPTHWEEFMPPVPLDGGRHPFTDDYIEDDGFYRNFLLRWPSDFVEQYEYDD